MTATDDFKPYGIIYCATNKVNGKRYVGQTTSTLTRRWATHCCPGGSCKYLSAAIQKYGKSSFHVEQIDFAQTLEELNAKELRYIAELDTTNRICGYNIRPGGNSSSPLESSKILMAAAKIGVRLTEEHKANISASGKGRTHSEESKLKQSVAKKGKKFSAEHIANLCKPRPNFIMSEEHKDAIRAATAVKVFSQESREKISNANKGRIKGPLGEETKAKLSLANKGRVRPIEDRMKISAGRKAAKNARELLAQI